MDLSKEIDSDQLESMTVSQTVFRPSQTSSATPSPSGGQSVSSALPLETFERLIIGHSVLSVIGFLVVLPFGAIISRWGRPFTNKWFKYHWSSQVVVSIPIVVIGWTLGLLAVADQGGIHADDAHKVCVFFAFVEHDLIIQTSSWLASCYCQYTCSNFVWVRSFIFVNPHIRLDTLLRTFYMPGWEF